MREVKNVPKLPARDRAGHKGTYGTVLLLCGDDGMLGAAILAARGALRGGAGLVRACLPEQLRAPFTVAAPCATTLIRQESPNIEEVRRWCEEVDAVVAGPGLGQAAVVRKMVQTLLAASEAPTVLDADALNVLAPLESTLSTRAPVVITPHPGEAARLLGSDGRSVQADRRAAAVELARRSGQIAVLKGAGTLVTDGDRVFENTTGNPGMATGGAGDVLSGLMGALLAQREALGIDPFDAACLAVHVHGAAGDLAAERLSQTGLCAEDLPEAIAEVLEP